MIKKLKNAISSKLKRSEKIKLIPKRGDILTYKGMVGLVRQTKTGWLEWHSLDKPARTVVFEEGSSIPGMGMLK